jgi:hypothetical protein
MNTFSHMLIGDFLQKYIFEINGVELDTASFVHGNLLPDFLPSYKKLPHTCQSWELYLKRESKTLSEHKQESTRFGPGYSRRLGIICHFYADFFCYAHTEAFQGGACQHFKYEWDLYRFTRKYYPALYWTDFGSGSSANQTAEIISGGFTALQQSYLKEEQAFENDIVYTLRACINAITLITSNSVIAKAPQLGPLVTGSFKV